MKELLSKINFKDKKFVTILLVVIVLIIALLIICVPKKNIRVLNLSDCSTLNVSERKIMFDKKLNNRETVLSGTPNVFTVENKCSGKTGYSLYLALNKNVKGKNIKLVMTEHNTKKIIKELNLSNLNNLKNAFSKKEIKTLNRKISGSADLVYLINTNPLTKEEQKFDIYFYSDKIDLNNLKGLFILKTYEIGE